MSEGIREVIPSKDAGSYGSLQRQKAQEGFGPKADLLITDDMKWESRLKRSDLKLVAEGPDGKIIGVSGAQILKDGKTANLRGLYVLPEERGKDLGTNLVKRMLELLKSNGVSTVVTEIEVTNRTSLTQHLKLGFKEVELITDRQGRQYKKLQISLNEIADNVDGNQA
jgi:N-acetylglutamate synthase-like GNAT family acetyltransferase